MLEVVIGGPLHHFNKIVEPFWGIFIIILSMSSFIFSHLDKFKDFYGFLISCCLKKNYRSEGAIKNGQSRDTEQASLGTQDTGRRQTNHATQSKGRVVYLIHLAQSLQSRRSGVCNVWSTPTHSRRSGVCNVWSTPTQSRRSGVCNVWSTPTQSRRSGVSNVITQHSLKGELCIWFTWHNLFHDVVPNSGQTTTFILTP
jgi:hypothetical protein